jgi:hypothetical protein
MVGSGAMRRLKWRNSVTQPRGGGVGCIQARFTVAPATGVLYAQRP